MTGVSEMNVGTNHLNDKIVSLFFEWSRDRLII